MFRIKYPSLLSTFFNFPTHSFFMFTQGR
jgi:hypothetical protein